MLSRAVPMLSHVCERPCTAALQNPQLQNQPLNAVPEYGGSSSHSANAVSFSGGPILTPQQILERLNDHVVGQESVKRVSLWKPLTLLGLLAVVLTCRCKRQPVAVVPAAQADQDLCTILPSGCIFALPAFVGAATCAVSDPCKAGPGVQCT